MMSASVTSRVGSTWRRKFPEVPYRSFFCFTTSFWYISYSNPTHFHVISKSTMFAAVSLRHFPTACGLNLAFAANLSASELQQSRGDCSLPRWTDNGVWHILMLSLYLKCWLLLLNGFEKAQEAYGLATIPKLPAGGSMQWYQVLKIRIGGGFWNIYLYSSQYMLHDILESLQTASIQENEKSI